MQTFSPTPYSRKPASATQPPPLTLLPPGPGRLQLLPPTQIVAEHVDDGCVLTQSDMRQFAEFLAHEFEHDKARAMWEPSGWYQEQVGSDICSEREAVQLRQMTIERCTKLDAMRELLAKGETACPPAVPWLARFGSAAAEAARLRGRDVLRAAADAAVLYGRAAMTPWPDDLYVFALGIAAGWLAFQVFLRKDRRDDDR